MGVAGRRLKPLRGLQEEQTSTEEQRAQPLIWSGQSQRARVRREMKRRMDIFIFIIGRERIDMDLKEGKGKKMFRQRRNEMGQSSNIRGNQFSYILE